MSYRDLGTAEAFLTVPSDMPPGYPVDAIHCALSRADAVLRMVSGQFDGSGGDRYCDDIICNALWAVSGEIQLLKTLIDHGYATEVDAAKACLGLDSSSITPHLVTSPKGGGRGKAK